MNKVFNIVLALVFSALGITQLVSLVAMLGTSSSDSAYRAGQEAGSVVIVILCSMLCAHFVKSALKCT